MDDLQSVLKSLLDDPQELEKLAQTASSFLQSDVPDSPPAFPDLNQVKAIMQKMDTGETQSLVRALSPFLSDARRKRLERASRIAQLSSIAELTLGREDGHG